LGLFLPAYKVISHPEFVEKIHTTKINHDFSDARMRMRVRRLWAAAISMMLRTFVLTLLHLVCEPQRFSMPLRR